MNSTEILAAITIIALILFGIAIVALQEWSSR